MSTTNLYRPEPLAVFLDRGGNPRDVVGDNGLACLVDDCLWVMVYGVDDDDMFSPALLEQVAASGVKDTVHHRMVWANETRTTAGLAERVVAFLDPAERAEFDHNLVEWIYNRDHPHPIEVERQESGERCSACGTGFDDGTLAMRITGDINVEIRYCYACVAIVYEALKAARGDQ